MTIDFRAVMISLMAAAAAGCAAWYIGRMSLQITYVTLADGRRQERRIPLMFRMLLPFAPSFRNVFSHPLLDKPKERYRRKILASGYSSLLEPYELMALRIMVPLVFGVGISMLIYFLLSRLPMGTGQMLLDRQTLIYLLIIVLSIFYPTLWLKSVLRARHRAIERALPFVLDLLTLSVESGVDFMTGIRRIVERRKIDALGEELLQVFRQIQVGKTRRQALRELADRIEHPDIYAVTNALIQADELGTSIAAALRIQADLMRVRRYQRAEKMANEAPVKMLFPLVAFIFPSVFIVLMGPIIMQLLERGF